MERWEYFVGFVIDRRRDATPVVKFGDVVETDLVKALNTVGREGWQLVQVISSPVNPEEAADRSMSLFFKRPL
jgi:hypothetical protein